MNFQLLAFCLLAVAYRAEAACTVVAIANGTPDPAVGQEVANSGTLNLVCDPGYAASAASTTCEATGTAFAATLTCDVATCAAEPTTLTQGSFPSAPTNGYTGTVSITCNSGYTVASGAASSSLCTDSDTWNPTTLACVFACNAAPTLTQGTFPTMPTGGYSGSESITCNPGYISASGAATSATCSATNTWSPTALTCTAATCAAAPTTLTQGTFPAVPSGGYTGTVAITCNSGYKAGSTNSSLCTSTDTWDPTSLVCTAITCSALTVTNGAVAPTGTVAYDGVVTVTCNSGYTLSSTTGDLKCDGTLANNYNATTPTCTATTTVSTAGSASLFHLHTALMAMLLSAFAFIKAL